MSSKPSRVAIADEVARVEREAAEVAKALGLNVQSVSDVTVRIGPMTRPNRIDDSLLVGHGGKTWAALLRLVAAGRRP